MSIMTNQNEIFVHGEGNQWFHRNSESLDRNLNEVNDKQFDWLEFIIKKITGVKTITSVCELGCSNGWRLEKLKRQQIFAPDCIFYGIDPSDHAIKDGQVKYPEINLSVQSLPKVKLNICNLTLLL
jgi:hypothetical protein